MAVAKIQLSARVQKESLDRFNSIVNFYRAQVPLGKVSRCDVMEDIINVMYERMKQLQQQGSVQKIKPPFK